MIKKVIPKKINKTPKQKAKFKFLPIIVALVLFAALGAYLTFFTKAASSGFYFSSSASTVAAGSTFNVQVRLNYGSPVDTVQAYITYPSNLEVVGSPSVEQPFESEFENNVGSPGLIKIQRADFSDSPPTGDNIISTITFKAKSAGSATVSFTNDTYGVYQSTKIGTIPKNNSTYTVAGATAAPVAPSSPTSSGPAPAPSAPAPSRSGSPATSSRTPSQPGQPAAATPGQPQSSTPSSPTQGPDPVTGLSNETIADAGGNSQYGSTAPPIGEVDSTQAGNKSNPAVITAISVVSVLALAGGAHLLLSRMGYSNGILGYVNSLRNPSGLTAAASSAAPVAPVHTTPGTIVGTGTAAPPKPLL